jgi:hypothetical protein
MGFFTWKSKFSKLHCYKKFIMKMRKIKIIQCTDFSFSVDCRVKFLKA